MQFPVEICCPAIKQADKSSPAGYPFSQGVSFSTVMEAYHPHFRPQMNGANLETYSNSDDFARHAATAKAYYHASQLNSDDALRVVFQREPTNIAMGDNQYNPSKLKELFGYTVGVFNDDAAYKTDGTSFRQLPNTVSIFSETYLWDPPGGAHKKEVAVLSLPAPALDAVLQPHYNYYIVDGKLDVDRYVNEMEVLFKMVERALLDNKDTAFGGRGFKRLVLSKFGQGAFLQALMPSDRETANQVFRKQLSLFIERNKIPGLEIVLSEYSPIHGEPWHEQIIVGDIVRTSVEGDLIVNAWDPHSAPGNGNDADHSFDGALGKSTAILLTQTAWLNPVLLDASSYIPI